jgi:HAE1 family hydrophobic/amphiphilic exporter-1
LPAGFTLEYGGEYEDQQRSQRELAVTLVLAIVLVYMVMAAQFESLVHPLIIMFAMPFGAIGVLLILLITKTSVNVQSMLGAIMLAGIVVNNAIVLIDYINMLRRTKGVALREAVEQGGRRRLRPILMTTLTTVLALTPMSIGLGAGGELQAPMARVVIGGLLTSTLITLVFVPTLYTMVEEFRERRTTRRDAVAVGEVPASH